jgi:hypothetical protein
MQAAGGGAPNSTRGVEVESSHPIARSDALLSPDSRRAPPNGAWGGVQAEVERMQAMRPVDAAAALTRMDPALKWRCFLGIVPAARAAIMLEMSEAERRLGLSMLIPPERAIAQRFLGIADGSEPVEPARSSPSSAPRARSPERALAPAEGARPAALSAAPPPGVLGVQADLVRRASGGWGAAGAAGAAGAGAERLGNLEVQSEAVERRLFEDALASRPRPPRAPPAPALAADLASLSALQASGRGWDRDGLRAPAGAVSGEAQQLVQVMAPPPPPRRGRPRRAARRRADARERASPAGCGAARGQDPAAGVLRRAAHAAPRARHRPPLPQAGPPPSAPAAGGPPTLGGAAAPAPRRGERPAPAPNRCRRVPSQPGRGGVRPGLTRSARARAGAVDVERRVVAALAPLAAGLDALDPLEAQRAQRVGRLALRAGPPRLPPLLFALPIRLPYGSARPAREGGRECAVGTRVGATVAIRPPARLAGRPCARIPRAPAPAPNPARGRLAGLLTAPGSGGLPPDAGALAGP